MMIVGITGGIGSGKTTVCSIFRQLGVPVYEADVEARKLYDLEPEIPDRIKKEIAEETFDKKGKLDKRKLSELVFQDEVLLKKLNKIVHPHVIRHFAEWKKQYSGAAYLLKETAILFESGANQDCDRVINISAPVELRIRRVIQRDKRTREDVEQIMLRQWSDEEKIKRSDFVVVNDEREMVVPQVLEIHRKIVSLLSVND